MNLTASAPLKCTIEVYFGELAENANMPRDDV